MEKLIELLNEYEKSWLNEFELEKYEEWWYCKWNWRIFRGNWENENELTPYELCSKQYWFIKWLVENEKVEWNNKDIAIKEWILWKSIDNYHSLLMALAIQDEPIEFLIGILK